MNCAKHTDLPAVAYCRVCGKAVCAECKRELQGAIYCEQCVAGRAAQPAVPPPPPLSTRPTAPTPPIDANPGLAAFLGFIPGVGAMYNGQFAKGFAHVIIFASLIWLSDHVSGIFGFGIAAWIFYMVFDAYTTAKARKYGLPLPDSLGINRMLGQMAGQQEAARAERQPANAPPSGAATPGAQPEAPPPGAPSATQAGFVAQQGAYYSGPSGTYYSGAQGQYAYAPPAPRQRADRGPVGALILIALGGLFLLGNLGFLHVNWDRFWPVILIVIGVAIFLRRFSNGKPPAAAPPAGDAAPPPEKKAE